MSSERIMEPSTKTGGRAATEGVIPGRYALSVGKPDIEPPHGWSWTALSSVARLETGHTPSRKHPEYWDGDVPWIGIRDATGNHGLMIHKTNQYTNSLGIENSSARVLPANTVCLSRTASVGYVVVMGVPMATSQDFVNWVCGDAIDYRFLKYILLAEHDSLLRFASGTTHQTIYFPEAKAFHVCLPLKQEQIRIADVLQSLDDRIALLRETNATLEAMAQALFKSWFVDFDPVHANAGNQTATLPPELQTLFPATFTETPQGLVPEGWCVGTIADLASVKGGFAYKSTDFSNSGLPVLKIKNIVGDGTVDVGDVQRISRALAEKTNRFALADGDVLMAMTGATIGKVGVVVTLNDETPYLNQRVAKFEEKKPNESNAWLIFTAFQNAFMTEQIVNAASGSAQPNISAAGIESAKLTLPNSNQVLRAFDDAVSPLFSVWINNHKQAQTLATLRDTLLPRLISGQLRLPEAEALVEGDN
jgi:type I restriction enzyme S subunit